MTELKDTTKSYPATSPQVAQMFGMSLNEAKKDESASVNIPSPTPENLPLQKDFEQIAGNLYIKAPQKNSSGAEIFGNKESPTVIHPPDKTTDIASFSRTPPKSDVITGRMVATLKAITPYVAVFSAALLVYFYFFSGTSINFTKIFQSAPGVAVTPKENSLATLEKQNLVGYQTWINQFYYDVSDAKVIDPDADNSGNGLSNFQKYLLNLNPKSYDTLGLGMADSQTLNSGIDPLTGGPLTDNQKSILAKYVDMEVVMNRLTLSNLQKNGEVAGANTLNTQNGNNSGNSAIPFGQSGAQGLTPAATANIGTSQQVQANSNNISPFDSSNSSDINTNIPGRLDIPSLNITAPLTWSSDTKNFDKDLQSGVIHYPGTALPGQIGTTYISGHSSNYVWAKGNYNHVFTRLGDLADNTSFTISVTLKTGKTVIYHYVVTGRQQYNPTDQAQFVNGSKSVVALSTCWPVGSTAKRLVVFGELTQVEQ